MDDLQLDDVPLGRVGKLFGLQVVAPKLREGEQIRWSRRANMIQQRVRSVGGRLHLTDRRLVFARNRTESLLGGKEWSADLDGLASVSTGRWRSIRVDPVDGRTERFFVESAGESAAIIRREIARRPDRRG